MTTKGQPGRAWCILRRAGLGLAGLMVLAAIAFYLLFESAGDNVERFCRESTPGLPVAEMAALARKHELRLTPTGRDLAGVQSLLAHSTKSFGRHTCLVRHDDKQIIDSRSSFVD